MKRLIALMMVLIVALCLVACGDGEPTKNPGGTTPPTTVPTTTVPPTSQAPTTENTVYNYRVRVLDQDGNPIQGAFVIFCLENCNFYETNEEGWALIEADIADGYKAHIMSLPTGYEDYTFSEEYIYFAPGQTNMTLVATKNAE